MTATLDLNLPEDAREYVRGWFVCEDEGYFANIPDQDALRLACWYFLETDPRVAPGGVH